MFSCPAISFFTLLSSHFINHLFFFTVEHSLSRRSLTFLFGLGPERKVSWWVSVERSWAVCFLWNEKTKEAKERDKPRLEASPTPAPQIPIISFSFNYFHLLRTPLAGGPHVRFLHSIALLSFLPFIHKFIIPESEIAFIPLRTAHSQINSFHFFSSILNQLLFWFQQLMMKWEIVGPLYSNRPTSTNQKLFNNFIVLIY